MNDRLIIETVSACNVRCVFCPMQVEKKIRFNYMKLEQFAQILRENGEYIRKTYSGVEPYYRGEPLIHKNFWEICALLRADGIQNWGINSNLSIKDPWLEGFLKFDVPLLVNMGGVTKEVHERVMKGSDYDLVSTNVKNLIRMGVPFQVKINPTKHNIHELCHLPFLIESWGGRKEQVVSYTTCYPVVATASQGEKDTFIQEVVSPDVEPYLRFTYDMSKRGYAIRAKKPGCNFLIDTIFFDGQMTVCCHDQLQDVNIGNVFEQSIESIRASDRYGEALTRAKRMEHPMCPECN